MKTLITAHRGASNLALENTLEAFEKAIALRADMIEFDVRRTKDEVLVVLHDADIAGLDLAALTYEQAGKLANTLSFHLPTLEESLKLARGKIPLEIELKEIGYEQQVLDLALKYLQPKDFRIISFNQISLKTIRKINVKIELGLIIGRSNLEDFTKLIFAILRKNQDYDALNLQYRLWHRGLVNLLPYKSKKIFLWTVDKKYIAAKIMKDQKIRGFSTNRPNEMLFLRKTMQI